MVKSMNLLVDLPFDFPYCPPLSLAILKAITPEFKCLDLSIDFNSRLNNEIEWKNDSRFNNCFAFERIFPYNVYNDIIRARNKEIFREIEKIILSYEPKIVGFHLKFSNLATTIILSRRLHKKGIRIIWGGPETLFNYRYFSRFSFVDNIVVGEAELTWEKVVNNMNDKVVFPPKICNLDETPIPDFSDFDLNRYKGVPIETQRGCINRCTFCSNRFFPYSENLRLKSIDKLRKEIRNVKKIKNNFVLCDNITNPTKERLIELCELFKKEGITWESYGFYPKVSEEEAYLMKISGCSLVALGVESFSNHCHKWLGKGLTVNDIVETLRNLKKYGIKAGLNMFFGFPKENIFDVILTLIRLEKYRDLYDGLGFSPYTLTTNSIVYNNPEKFGIKKLNEKVIHRLMGIAPYYPRKEWLNLISDFIIHYFNDKLAWWEF